MARQTSKSIEETYRFPHHAHLHLLVKLSGVRAAYRRQFIRLFGQAKAPCGVPCGITGALEEAALAFQNNAWAFLEGVFTPEFHGRLVENWPRSYYFRPIRQITKSYDIGFSSSTGAPGEPEFLEHHPIIRTAYNYLRGEDFCKRVTAFCGDGIERACYSLLLTRSYPGSSVIPHRDTVALEPEGRYFLNFVFFVSGTGGERTGGLCIINDPEYQDLVFEPRNLTNSAIVYQSAAPFFHGFRPMRLGTYRWTINAQFCGKNWLADKLGRAAWTRRRPASDERNTLDVQS